MKHEEVAEAFVAGVPAKNRRLVTDGTHIVDNGTYLATKTSDGILIVWMGAGRSGSIARSAIRRVVARQFGKIPYSWVHSRTRPRSPAELIAEHEETVKFRKSVGLPPIHTL